MTAEQVAKIRAHVEAGKKQAMTKFAKDWGTQNVRDIIPSLRKTIKGSKNPGDWAKKARKHFAKSGGVFEQTLIETRMPKSVLNHRIKIQNMSDTEKKKHFAGKGIDLLRSMSHRHGFGPNSDEYAKYHDGKTPDKNTSKINEHQRLSEISQQVAHNYTMKAIKSHKKLESDYVNDIQSGRKPKFADVFRKIRNRAAGVNRAQRRLNKKSAEGYAYYMQLAVKADAEGKKDNAKHLRIAAHRESQAKLKEGTLWELAADSSTNWGGWQGGFPGTGSALKGLKGDANDKAKNMTKPAKKREDGSSLGDEIKLSKEKTKVIFNPTQRETENNLDNKDMGVAKNDNPVQKPKPTKQVKEMTEHKARKLLKKALRGKNVKPKKLAKAMNKTAKGSRPSWMFADKRLSEEELLELSDKVVSDYAQQAVQTKEDDPKYKKRMKGLSQAFQNVGRKRSLSMSGTTMTGGEETIYEDLLTWALRTGVRAFKNHRAKKKYLAAKQQIAANRNAKISVKPPKQKITKAATPQPEKKSKFNSETGPWGKRPIYSTPKVTLKKEPEKPEQTIDKSVSREVKNKAATGGVSSDNKMSAADLRSLLAKNPKLKIRAGGSNEETVVEMTRRAIGSYLKASIADVKKRNSYGYFNPVEARKNSQKIVKREKGIGKAVDRLSKEETLVELTAQKIKDYRDKAYKDIDKQPYIGRDNNPRIFRRISGLKNASYKLAKKSDPKFWQAKVPANG